MDDAGIEKAKRLQSMGIDPFNNDGTLKDDYDVWHEQYKNEYSKRLGKDQTSRNHNKVQKELKTDPKWGNPPPISNTGLTDLDLAKNRAADAASGRLNTQQMSKESAMPTNDAKKRKALVDDVRKRNKKDKDPEVRNRKVTHMDDYLAEMGPDNVKKALASGDREDKKAGHTRFKEGQLEKQRKADTAPLNSKQRDKLMGDLKAAGGSYKKIEPSEETTMASKKTGTKDSGKKSKNAKGKAASTDKTDAVDAAGAKAKDAVSAAVERNPVSGPPSPAGSADNTGSGKSTERTPKPSSKLRGTMAPKEEEDGTPFDGDAYTKSDEGKASRAAGMEKGKNKSPLRAAEDADARAKSSSGQEDRASQQWKQSRLRAGAEGTSGKSKGTRVGANDTTTEMPATTKDKDAERADRIKELATSGVSKDPNDKGEMPDDPKPRTKPTVLVTPNDKGEMPDPNKPGFMSRLRGRMKSFTTPAGGGAPPTPPAGSGGGSTPPPSGSGGGSTPPPPPPPPPPSGGKKLPDPTPDSPRAINNQNSGYQVNRGLTMTGSISGVAEGANVFSAVGEGAQLIGDRNTTQNITGGAGQPITATTTGKATSSGGRGITASTSGTASSHPRAANATRGGRPTSRKK